MTVQLFESSRFEDLWQQFEHTLRAPPEHPLVVEKIVVPASGWESYVTRELALRKGCFAQFKFTTLGKWMSDSLAQLGDAAPSTVRDVETLTWSIAAALPKLLEEASFSSVRAYLREGGADEASLRDDNQRDENEAVKSAIGLRRLLDLSRCVAGLYDQYLVSRPDLIKAWNSGQDWPDGGSAPGPHASWQRLLWQAASRRSPQASVASAIQLYREQGIRPSQPERSSVWVCGLLPPVVAEFLEAMGDHAEIHVYLLSPWTGYWRSQSRADEHLRALAQWRKPFRDYREAEDLPAPHPLLESLGRLSLDREALLATRPQSKWQFNRCESEQVTGPTTLLTRVQDDLKQGRAVEHAEYQVDESIRVHSCHSAIREVEVMRDQVRAAFERDPKLRPEQVLILCPDLDAYAPLIQAVFSTPTGDAAGPIPVHVAGRSPRKTRPVVEAFFRVLEVLEGRFAASVVLDMLNVEAVAAAANLSFEEIATLAEWVADSEVRWGLDAGQRTDESLPDSDLNTWQFGFDRLILGYAMPPGGEQVFGSSVALDRASGLEGETLGRAWQFLNKLQTWRREVGRPRPLADWRVILLNITEDFLAEETDDLGLQRLREAVNDLVDRSTDGGFDGELPFSTVVRELGRGVDQIATGTAFRLGGITVCDLAARRSLPHEIIGLLGLNDGLFPRLDRPVGFDLLADDERPGDRNLRWEDKHLLLEALLAARRQLIVTYQGQDVQDQRERPPSVLVEELVDFLSAFSHKQTSTSDRSKAAAEFREAILVQHPLQAFGPSYFNAKDQRLFSYDNHALQAAMALQNEKADVPRFIPRTLEPDEEMTSVRQTDLRRCLEAPWETFLARLGVWIGEGAELESDQQPLVIDALEAWQVGDAWLHDALARQPAEAISMRLRRSGQLPDGALGRRRVDDAVRNSNSVLEEARKQGVPAEDAPTPIRFDVAGVQITGRLLGVTTEGIRRATYSDLKTRHLLRHWLDHLLLTVARQQSHPTLVIGRGSPVSTIRFREVPLSAAKSILADVVSLYRMSLCLPLPFFSDSVAVAIDEIGSGDFSFNDADQCKQLCFRGAQAYQAKFNGTAAIDLPSVRVAFAGRHPFEMTCGEVPGCASFDQKNLFLHLVETICVPLVEYRAIP